MSAIALAPPAAIVRSPAVRTVWLAAGVMAVLIASVAGLTMGAVSLSPVQVVGEVLDHIPGIRVRSGLDARQAAIVWELRLPRVVLGLLVGATLAIAGASYQGVFRNPLADPYLLGAAAGAGLGATLAIAAKAESAWGPFETVSFAAFVGAVGAVALSWAVANAGGGSSSTAVLLLAGVAVASFLTAIQTFVLQRNTDDIRQVYTFLLGRLTTASWHEVAVLAPYTVVAATVLLVHRRTLDVLSVGDEEAQSLGLPTTRTRLIVVAAASLATAAAVSASGLIAFVGIIVPHTVRLLAGSSYRIILPLSLLFGAAFLTLADLVARLALAPAEVPIGVVTAMAGAPFFAIVLRTRHHLV